MKLSKLRAILLAFHIVGKIIDALTDPLTPGEITKEELHAIITTTLQEVFGKLPV
jgi:hypothetical protein